MEIIEMGELIRLFTPRPEAKMPQYYTEEKCRTIFHAMFNKLIQDTDGKTQEFVYGLIDFYMTTGYLTEKQTKVLVKILGQEEAKGKRWPNQPLLIEFLISEQKQPLPLHNIERSYE
jgi:hypothetical protein